MLGKIVTAAQRVVVLERTLSQPLAARRIEDPDGLCSSIIGALGSIDPEPSINDTPEAVFAMLGGN